MCRNFLLLYLYMITVIPCLQMIITYDCAWLLISACLLYIWDETLIRLNIDLFGKLYCISQHRTAPITRVKLNWAVTIDQHLQVGGILPDGEDY